MKAEDAKKLAESNKKQMEENRKLRIEKAKDAEVELLLNHFRSKIDQAIMQGKTCSEEMTFPLDRFSNEVIQEVAKELREDGYSINMNKHNAFQKVAFIISWA